MTKLFALLLILFSMQIAAQIRPTPISAPVLVFPANGASVTAGKAPVFAWLASVPVPSDQLTYKIKIVEIIGDQSPEDALKSNKPHFEKDSLKGPGEKISFPYPSSAPGFVAGKKYGWMIQCLNRDMKSIGQNNRYSKAVQFSAIAGTGHTKRQ